MDVIPKLGGGIGWEKVPRVLRRHGPAIGAGGIGGALLTFAFAFVMTQTVSERANPATTDEVKTEQ